MGHTPFWVMLMTLIWWVEATSTEDVLDVSKERGVEVNSKKTFDVCISCHHNSGWYNNNINNRRKLISLSFVNLAKFKYLITTVGNENCIHAD
jgi:hypothetical protein